MLSSTSFEEKVKTISIGNLSVGGTGKTPHTEYIVELLKSQCFKPEQIAILSRGYKRKTKGFKLALQHSSYLEIGDEPAQFKHRFNDVAVAVCEQRVKGIERLLGEIKNLKIVVLDDAYQHRAIQPGLSILLTRVDNLYVDDHLLPFGSLRESTNNSKRADMIVVTKGYKAISPIEKRIIKEKLNPLDHQKVFFSHIQYQSIVPLHSGEYKHSINKKTSILLVTGIANSEHLYYYLKHNSRDIEHLNFSDHHQFTDKDLQSIIQAYNDLYSPIKIILTTQKDAIRLKAHKNSRSLLDLPIYYIPIKVGFNKEDEQAFNQEILHYVTNH